MLALKTCHGKFVHAQPDGWVLGGSDYIAPWVKFQFTKYADSTITLQGAYGKFVSADPEGRVYATMDIVGNSERLIYQIEESRRSDGLQTLSLMSPHGKYVSAQKDGLLHASKDVRSASEVFVVVRCDDIFNGTWDKGVILDDKFTWTGGKVSQVRILDSDKIEIEWDNTAHVGELRGDRIHWSNKEVWSRQEQQGFDGSWDKGVIAGDKLTWMNGEISHIRRVATNEIEITCSGNTLRGQLIQNEIRWSDGEVWIHNENHQNQGPTPARHISKKETIKQQERPTLDPAAVRKSFLELGKHETHLLAGPPLRRKGAAREAVAMVPLHERHQPCSLPSAPLPDAAWSGHGIRSGVLGKIIHPPMPEVSTNYPSAPPSMVRPPSMALSSRTSDLETKACIIDGASCIWVHTDPVRSFNGTAQLQPQQFHCK
jgi:hypothetical protein